ncbi:hypothetical protein UZ979_12990, partial [Escherichia coli]|nr:hypothetical protein [Escherichia coli]
AEFTIGEGELMAHDVPLGCAPDEYDDLISGTCSHLPYHAEFSGGNAVLNPAHDQAYFTSAITTLVIG